MGWNSLRKKFLGWNDCPLSKQCPHGPLWAYRPSPILVTEGTRSFAAETLGLGHGRRQNPSSRPPPLLLPRPLQSQLRRPGPATSAELYSAKVVSLMGRTIKKAKKAKSKKTKVPYRTLLFLESWLMPVPSVVSVCSLFHMPNSAVFMAWRKLKLPRHLILRLPLVRPRWGRNTPSFSFTQPE